jgi:hypothetical protein
MFPPHYCMRIYTLQHTTSRKGEASFKSKPQPQLNLENKQITI